MNLPSSSVLPWAIEETTPAPTIFYREKFCTLFGLRREHYSATVLEWTLYPHARCLRPAIDFFFPRFFSAERELVLEAGNAADRRDSHFATEEFHRQLAHRIFFRRVLRLCISPVRFEQLIEQVWNSSP